MSPSRESEIQQSYDKVTSLTTNAGHINPQPLAEQQYNNPPPSLVVNPVEGMSHADSMTQESMSPIASSPVAHTSRYPAHVAATSPLRPPASPLPNPHRRPSSAMSTNGSQSLPSPRLAKKSSRSSLGGPSEQAERRPTPKRSISNLIAGLREAQSSMATIEEPVPLTAEQIAALHFQRELARHHDSDLDCETVVILHDACYGHRWSRLRTTKTTLSMIVERPERIRACVLGASLAYVRLGQHHAGAKYAPHPLLTAASTTPPFRVQRSSRSIAITEPCVTNVHGTAWMNELHGLCATAADKLAAGAQELTRSTSPNEPEKPQLHEGDLYLAPESLAAFEGALGGVADAVDAVFSAASVTRAFVAVRPPGHHCSAGHPSGFCWLNNVHVGIEYAAQVYGLTHAAILDFDLHHGDGSQAITWERNRKNNAKRLNSKATTKLKLAPDIGYYSLHDINSYPCEMGDDDKVQAASLCIDNAHGQSIWNVHLQPWRTEEEFWKLYETQYSVLLDKARSFLVTTASRVRSDGKQPPRAALFISAGFDASEWEGSGMQRHKVNVPTEFYARFTRDIIRIAHEQGTACDGRVISVLEGGYSDRALCSGVLSHLSGLCAEPVVRGQDTDGDVLDMAMRGLQIGGSTSRLNFTYDKYWWSSTNLTALENEVSPPPPMPGKKVRNGSQPTYATPTESFAYKVIDPNKFARSVSGTLRDTKPTKPPSPPPPEVNWITATQALSKQLIPEDRTTTSCTAEELAIPKARKEKPESVEAFTPASYDSSKGRQLRDRSKVKPTVQYADSVRSDETVGSRSVSRSSNRRQTVHDLPSASNTSREAPAPRPRRESRRLSAISQSSTNNHGCEPMLPPPVPRLPDAGTDGEARPLPARASSSLQIRKTRPPVKTEEAINVQAASAPVSPAKAVVHATSARLKSPLGDFKPTGNDEIDNLASGMKRISLKVGTREEHDRKQKERDAVERRARALKGAETRRLNAAAKKVGGDHKNLPAAKSQLPIASPLNRVEMTNPAPPGSSSMTRIHMPVDVAHSNLSKVVPQSMASTRSIPKITQPSARPSQPLHGIEPSVSVDINQPDQNPAAGNLEHVPNLNHPQWTAAAALQNNLVSQEMHGKPLDSDAIRAVLPKFSSSSVIPFAPPPVHFQSTVTVGPTLQHHSQDGTTRPHVPDTTETQVQEQT